MFEFVKSPFARLMSLWHPPLDDATWFDELLRELESRLSKTRGDVLVGVVHGPLPSKLDPKALSKRVHRALQARTRWDGHPAVRIGVRRAIGWKIDVTDTPSPPPPLTLRWPGGKFTSVTDQLVVRAGRGPRGSTTPAPNDVAFDDADDFVHRDAYLVEHDPSLPGWTLVVRRAVRKHVTVRRNDRVLDVQVAAFPLEHLDVITLHGPDDRALEITVEIAEEE